MKTTLLLLSLVTLFSVSGAAQTDVTLNINHRLGVSDFSFNNPTLNDLGHDFEFTRLEYYMSQFVLIHDGGVETTVEDVWILVDASQPVNVVIGNFNITELEEVKFRIGVDPAHNHEDPASYDAGHPLAPQFPSMHWGWAAGYRFVALEGYGGSSLNQGVELHGLEDPNYFQQSHAVSVTAENGELLIDLDADYLRSLDNISVSGGAIVHGGYGAAKVCLQNFRDFVFSPAGTVVSVDNNEAVNSFTVYPNPSESGVINVSLDAQQSALQLRVTDSLGRTVQLSRIQPATSFATLELDGSGLFFVSLTDTNGVVETQRLIVQ